MFSIFTPDSCSTVIRMFLSSHLSSHVWPERLLQVEGLIRLIWHGTLEAYNFSRKLLTWIGGSNLLTLFFGTLGKIH